MRAAQLAAVFLDLGKLSDLGLTLVRHRIQRADIAGLEHFVLTLQKPLQLTQCRGFFSQQRGQSLAVDFRVHLAVRGIGGAATRVSLVRQLPESLFELDEPVGDLVRVHYIRALLDGARNLRDARLVHGRQITQSLLQRGKLPRGACDLHVLRASSGRGRRG